MAKEKWYRTGAVADETGISRYRLRALAKEGLIESRSNNGMLYIPASTVERLKANGPPAMPARAVDDLAESQPSDEPDNDEAHALIAPRRTAPRSRLTEELYADPSPQLVKSKERVIRLEHSVEVKRLQQQCREIDRLAEEERARAQEQRLVQEWRDAHIHRVLEKVPGEYLARILRSAFVHIFSCGWKNCAQAFDSKGHHIKGGVVRREQMLTHLAVRVARDGDQEPVHFEETLFRYCPLAVAARITSRISVATFRPRLRSACSSHQIRKPRAVKSSRSRFANGRSTLEYERNSWYSIDQNYASSSLAGTAR